MILEQLLQVMTKYKVKSITTTIDIPIPENPHRASAVTLEMDSSAFTGETSASDVSPPPIGLENGNPSYEEMAFYSSVPLSDDEKKQLPKDETNG